MMRPAVLDTAKVLRQTFVVRLEHFALLESTNDWAAEFAKKGVEPGTLPLLVVADRQTAGRGRGNHRWWTGEGSLACTLLMETASLEIEPARQPMVALAAGMAIVDAVSALLPAHTVGLHWPNDVYACGRKLAGVLIEVLPNGLWLVGIGLNTNSTIDDAPTELRHAAITLRDLTGSRHDQTSILVAVLRHFEKHLRQLQIMPDELGRKADALCLQHGRPITLDVGGQRIVRGTCVGIGTDGALLLETPDGRQRFFSGSIVPEHGHVSPPHPAVQADVKTV